MTTPVSIFISDSTTPAEALRIAYERGCALNAGPGDAFEFGHALAIEVNQPYGHSKLLPFLRVGFAAGYFKQPFPKIERMMARRAVTPEATSPSA